MSYLEYHIKSIPTGPRKILYLNFPLIGLLIAIASFGFLILYSVAGGALNPWVEPQVKRFAAGLAIMFFIAFIPIWFWRNVSFLGYLVALALLVAVEFFGTAGMGAQRWLDLGFIRLQPSEVMKIVLVMALAAYYDLLPLEKTSHIGWVCLPLSLILMPTMLVLRQPDLGTALLLMAGGATVMFAAGVRWGYFVSVLCGGIAMLIAVFQSRGTSWQLLKDYQFDRIDTFLDPARDPLGAGYHITQSKIALGSGGWTGRGFMEGTQSRLNFLPEKHTDFIFTTLAEEFGFVGAMLLLVLYGMVILFCLFSAWSHKDRFSALLILGLTATFFFFLSVNMGMVMGLLPVVGVPLPLVSYGGSAMLVLMIAFGLIQSAHVHNPR